MLSSRNRPKEDRRNKGGETRQEQNLTDRWQALVRYDNEISAAAEKLRPFGDSWVDRLGREFFALKEDRRYLANIVQSLIDDAKQQEALRKKQEALSWPTRFQRTAEGEICTEASLKILREAEARGYALAVEPNRSFSLTKTAPKRFFTQMQTSNTSGKYGRASARPAALPSTGTGSGSRS
jgi:hypothetical protein